MGLFDSGQQSLFWTVSAHSCHAHWKAAVLGGAVLIRFSGHALSQPLPMPGCVFAPWLPILSSQLVVQHIFLRLSCWDPAV